MLKNEYNNKCKVNQLRLERKYIIMKKHNRPEIIITWKFIDEDEIYTSKGYSAGLASLACDPMVEIIEVKEA